LPRLSLTRLFPCPTKNSGVWSRAITDTVQANDNITSHRDWDLWARAWVAGFISESARAPNGDHLSKDRRHSRLLYRTLRLSTTTARLSYQDHQYTVRKRVVIARTSTSDNTPFNLRNTLSASCRAPKREDKGVHTCWELLSKVQHRHHTRTLEAFRALGIVTQRQRGEQPAR
jgi:hypothetical protein